MIAGIDYSTKAVDVVLLDEDSDQADWYRFELEGQDAFDRARDVHRAFNFTSELWDSVVAVGIEDPRGYNAGALYRVQGAILVGIPWHKLVQPWIPSQWRKAVGLPGNATKQAVATWAVRRIPIVPPALMDVIYWPQDAYDAYCIALATKIALTVEAAA